MHHYAKAACHAGETEVGVLVMCSICETQPVAATSSATSQATATQHPAEGSQMLLLGQPEQQGSHPAEW